MGRGERSRSPDDGTTPSSLPQTTPQDYAQPTHDFTLQTVVGLEKTIAVLSQKIDRLLDDRREDRAENRTELKDFRADFKDFQKTEFKTLSDEVVKLRLNWAKVIGASAIVGAVVSFVVAVIKTKLGV